MAQALHSKAPVSGMNLRVRPSSHRAAQPIRCSATQKEAKSETNSRRALLLGIAGLSAASVLSTGNAKATTAAPFLQNTGAKGILAEEEAQLYKLRQEKEGEARRALLQEKEKYEAESKQQVQEGRLCATPFGVDIVGITEFIALIGALVGGITARQRKEELERLNEQLRKINLGLRQQARAGTVYAPGLSYAPAVPEATTTASPTPSRSAPKVNPHNGKVPAAAVAVAAPATATATAPTTSATNHTILSMEEDELTSDQIQCRDALRAGKRLLKERNGAAAMVRFEKALMLSKALADKVQERRAMRGLAASARLQGQYKTAIKHLESVLEISKAMQEYTGDADAYGTIADCFTDLGEFEKAAMFYDKYIEAMNKDGPV